MESASRTFIPAAGRDWRLPLYDPLVRLLGGDGARRALLDQTALLSGHRVLDVGCGTGSLSLLVKQLFPQTEVTGLDPDPRALDRARQKAARSRLAIQWDRGFADALPYPDQSFDRVVSSFVLHHLRGETKGRMLAEVLRVLKPGGLLCILDMVGGAAGPRGGVAGFLHSHTLLLDSRADRVLASLAGAGFENPRSVKEGALAWRAIPYACFQAAAPLHPRTTW